MTRVMDQLIFVTGGGSGGTSNWGGVSPPRFGMQVEEI